MKILKDICEWSDEKNKVISESTGCDIVINGVNNDINIGKNKINGRLKIECSGNNNRIIIGNNVCFQPNSRIRLMGNATVVIGSNVKFSDVDIWCWGNNYVMIDNESTFWLKFSIYAHTNGKVHIGKDCMFSRDIVIQTGNGHPIYDVTTGKSMDPYVKKINYYLDKVIIGNHVWCGRSVMILGGSTKICDGSIIGAASFVKGKYLFNNVVLAGDPAKIKKENIAWGRSRKCNNIDDCNGYAALSVKQIDDDIPFYIDDVCHVCYIESLKISDVIDEQKQFDTRTLFIFDKNNNYTGNAILPDMFDVCIKNNTIMAKKVPIIKADGINLDDYSVKNNIVLLMNQLSTKEILLSINNKIFGVARML